MPCGCKALEMCDYCDGTGYCIDMPCPDCNGLGKKGEKEK